MTDDYRHPSLIIEELSDLQKLIKENEDLMSEYPDKLSLKFRNQSFRDRQDFLLSELMNSLERLQINAFDVVIEGDVVADHRIPLSFFGDLMSNYQDITSSIAQALTGKPTIKGTISSDILKASQLDLLATATGSFKVILSSHQPQIGESSVKTSLRYFNDLIECGDNKEAIKELASKLGIRVLKKYNNFLMSYIRIELI